MILDTGKLHIKRYLAGFVPAIAQSMAFGIGELAEAQNQTSLQLEIARSPIALTYYDFALNKLIYRAPIPDEYKGKVYEVGLYTLASDPNNAEYSSRTITTFDSATENWVDPADGVTLAEYVPNTNPLVRVGSDALFQNPTAGVSMSHSLRDITLNLAGYSGEDVISMAFYVGNLNTYTVIFKFMTDASNYYSYTIGTTAQTVGYKIISAAKSGAVVTGNPDWGNITEIQVETTSKGSGQSLVFFDAIRVEDRDSNTLDHLIVARKVLPAPVTKVDGKSQDFEFMLDVTV